MPMNIKLYPPDWKAISLRIRQREDWKCKWCSAENGKPHPVTGSRVVLTVAHLGTQKDDGEPGDKRDKMDVRDCNLAALCQKCHLTFDAKEHAENRRRTAARRLLEAKKGNL